MTTREETRSARSVRLADRAPSLAMLAMLASFGPLAARPSLALAQAPRSVRVSVGSLFGDGTALPDHYVPFRVSLENRSGQNLRGEVHLTLVSYSGSTELHVAHVDLPSEARREVVLTAFVGSSGSELDVRFVANGRTLGMHRGPLGGIGSARSVVLLGDPPRLRGALLDLDVSELGPSGPMQARAAVGVLSLDGQSGDALMPTDALGWASVRLLVAHTAALGRASEAQRAALVEWLRAGGRMLVLPRVATDLNDPWLRALAGPVALGPPDDRTHPLVPEGVGAIRLGCSEAQVEEAFGCSASVGFGRVYLASYDASSALAMETAAPRELVRSVYVAVDPTRPAYELGRSHDDLEVEFHLNATTGLGALRAALDPNESFRPALWGVALVLLLYVVVVGPLNFRWVQRKNQPTLALVTTPLAALACMIVLLGVAYLGKGATTRYRRSEVLELVEGERRGPARRYTGLFVTRPGTFDFGEAVDHGGASRVGSGSASGPVYRHEGGRVRLNQLRAGLWETVFLREDRMLDAGGGVRLVREGPAVVAVVNETPQRLRDAFWLGSQGQVRRLGDLAPGQRVALPRSGPISLPIYDTRSAADVLGRALSIPAERRPRLQAVTRTILAGATYVEGPRVEEALYARVELPRASLSGTFSQDFDERWLRVVPRTLAAPVQPAPPPENPLAQLGVEDAGADAGDAGTDGAGAGTDAGVGAGVGAEGADAGDAGADGAGAGTDAGVGAGVGAEVRP